MKFELCPSSDERDGAAVTSVVEVVEEVEEVEVVGYAGLVRELAVLAPMLDVQLMLQSVPNGATVSVPLTDQEDLSVALRVMLRTMSTPGHQIMEEDAGMEVVEARTGNLDIKCPVTSLH